MGKFKDLTGKKFTNLTALRYMGKSKWLCECICGNKTIVYITDLKSGRTKSCGCLHRIVDGMYGTKFYYAWHGIIQRCRNSNHKNFDDYGGKGISYCKGGELLTIEEASSTYNVNTSTLRSRISRCSSAEDMVREVKVNRYLYKGELLTIPEISKVSGIPYGTITRRLWAGWSLDRSFNTPRIVRKQHGKSTKK